MNETKIKEIEKLSPDERAAIESIFKTLQANGVTTHQTKPNYILTQVQRRLHDIGIRKIADYLVILKEFEEQELPILLHISTIHTTRFYREGAHFEALRSFAKKPGTVRVWVSACSSGEEAYSAAMELYDAYQTAGKPPMFEILATDVDIKSVEEGKNGVYAVQALDDIPKKYHNKFIELENSPNPEYFRIKETIASKITWQPMNLLALDTYRDWKTFTGKFDAVFCRNVFIYFDTLQIGSTVSHIRSTLRPGGRFFVGFSESLSQLKLGLNPVQHAVYEADATLSNIETPDDFSVILVDDSKTLLGLVRKMLARHSNVHILGAYEDGQQALDALNSGVKPDVILTDMMMPVLDGPALIREQMKLHKIPTIVMSALSESEASAALNALEEGAFDYVEKPSMDNLEAIETELVQKLEQGALSKRRGTIKAPNISARPSRISTTLSAKELLIVLGSSTGGPDALRYVLGSFSATCPPTIVAQHMPGQFTGNFARRLNELCEAEVVEATDGMEIVPGRIIIAPGSLQTQVYERLGQLVIRVSRADPDQRYKPSVDALFNSVAQLRNGPGRVIAGLMTGMGSDGAEGLASLREKGASTWGQDEASSVVFGMARRAAERGACAKLISLEQIPSHLADLVREAEVKARVKHVA